MEEFNLEKIKEYATIFTQCTNVGVAVLDKDSNVIFGTDKYYVGSTFCNKIKKEVDFAINCHDGHVQGMEQSNKFGGKYIYFCPLGLVHFVCPIIKDGVTQGAFLGGPVVTVDKNDYFAEEIKSKFDLTESTIDELEALLKQIPQISIDRVSSLSQLLLIMTSNLSDNIKYISQNNKGTLDFPGGTNELDTHSVSNYPFEAEKELLAAITAGDKTTAQRLLNEILGYIFFSSNGAFDVIKARVLELVVLLSRAAMDGGADSQQIFGLNHRYLTEINYFTNVEDLSFWLSKIMSRFTDYVFNFVDVKHVDVIYKAVNYINRNFHKKVTLEDVAAHVYLSPSYLSKIFKDEMKCNFNTYLNQIRIENAKKMLLKDGVNLVDVSASAGFEDQSYFSKVFKKMTGITPGKYKESRGKLSAR